MSAIVCGKRSPSSFFEDPILNHQNNTNKRIRRYSSSLSPTRPLSFDAAGAGLARLQSMFPHMDPQLLERVLEESGNDLDSAIRSLNDLCLESAEGNIASVATTSDAETKTTIQHLGDANAFGATNVQTTLPGAMASDCKEEPGSANGACMDNLPRNGSEWVEVLVTEMMAASNVDDAKVRASRVLDVLEKSILANAGSTEAFQILQKENILLKEQLETLLKENNVLKRIVTIQHERQKEYEEKSQELPHLKQLVAQYKEQLAKLEVSNYALAMHLKQAQQSNSISGRFHPDVF
ncbi:uncharacterized protein M6B38_264560 [Iris pallida]|uniref:CUE domain-containing protein n=1 Tax=Iris pallida TaxID=29817 RepID=A0AAX6DSS8_IRIPA|nr:uncharacterized protein M6B38_227950 [Iris pallida]KAJ6850313.1 uncharacterized protein M6B38_264560 [Iris pallida]